MVFDREWFGRHQHALLWLLNHWLTRRWFRWVLRIRRHDAGYRGRIVRLLPNSYTVVRGVEFVADFRTHDKYAKRLYHAFKPMWWAMHFLDWLVLDRFIPALSFGFLTLTAFPDTGNPGASSVDLTIYRDGVNEAWATIIAGTGTSATNVTDDVIFEIACSGTTNQFSRLTRFFCHFDTSSLGASASISAATLSLFGAYKDDTLGVTPNTNIYSSTVTSNNTLASSDFGQVGSTAFATAISFASFSTSGYNDFALNASGISNISTTGVSKFSARNANYDAAAVAPTWSSGAGCYTGCNHADTAGTTSDPKLVVTYTVGGGSFTALMNATPLLIFQ